MQDRDNLPLTIFTPAYNRSAELERLCASLCKQTDMRFEWLIVDDGSTDDTCGAVSAWAQHVPFAIRYIKQENSGKHVAHNRGAAEANGRYFMCIDSDDWLEPNAVESVLSDAAALDTEEGLLYPKLFAQQTALDTWFPDNVEKVELADMRMKYGLIIETAIVFNTQVLKRHPFPVVEGERFMPEESAYYDFVAPELFRVRAEPFYRCEYLEEGLTKNIWKNWLNNPVGTRMALGKRREAAERYSGMLALRERVSALAGIESLNIAVGTPVFTGIESDKALSLLTLPLSLLVERKRFGGK
ncbi:glycosyltransferase family A protein [Granulimonas faecalis]|uniref:glycosyltransferase family A protein n=1 Tax=Granulimonas faecalis TaxID=2894155 RepID=UPI003514ABB3